jgi:hypothetical protein
VLCCAVYCCAVLCLQHAQVVSNKTGTIPLKLPKPLLLSQFNRISLPHCLPLDLVVDGMPAGGCCC